MQLGNAHQPHFLVGAACALARGGEALLHVP
jgi:hypothetical protein